MQHIDVDGGYVRLLDYMGTDLTPVNAARASFQRRTATMRPQDERLLGYLAESRPAHTMPYRHPQLTVEVKAPIFIARQWYRHLIGARYVDTAWSEASGRYIAYDGHWTPSVLRPAPANRKQGSGEGAHPRSDHWIDIMQRHSAYSQAIYEDMIADGVAPEQARTILGLNVFTSWHWTASLQAAAHVVNLRTDPHAQAEIRPYAAALDTICAALWPVAWQWRSHL